MGPSPIDSSESRPTLVANAIVQRLTASASLSPTSSDRLSRLIERFGRFIEIGLDVQDVRDVGPDVVRAFLRSRTGTAGEPSVATMHLRRSAVRLMYREGRAMGLLTGDPSADVFLAPRSSLRVRPLADDEIELCRAYTNRTIGETRQPAAWALAEATARTSELPRIRACDVELKRSRVWIPGGRTTEARWGELTDWGRGTLERHLGRALDAASSLVAPRAVAGTSAEVSASIAIGATLRRAGLHSEPDVRPSSVAAWVGATALARGVPLPDVARSLGLRSLDRTAEFIGFEWRAES